MSDNCGITDFLPSSGLLSVDRVTLLIESPYLSVWTKDEGYNKRMDRIERFRSLFDSMIQSCHICLDPDYPQGCRSDLFLHHYRVFSGLDEEMIDVQFGCTSPVRKRITDESYIMAFGSEEEKEQGYIDNYIPSQYGFRLEWNPNFSDISILNPILSGLCRSNLYSTFIRVSRLDIAIDYPFKILPELVHCNSMRKGFLAYGSQGTETLYFGSRASKYMFRIYDKATQLREVKGHDVQGDLWRVELEIKDPFSIFDTPLAKFGKVFDRLSFYSDGISSGDWCLDLILKNAMNYGLDNTLNSLPSTTKKRYKKLIQAKASNFNLETPGSVYRGQFLGKYNVLRNSILQAFGLQGRPVES